MIHCRVGGDWMQTTRGKQQRHVPYFSSCTCALAILSYLLQVSNGFLAASSRDKKLSSLLRRCPHYCSYRHFSPLLVQDIESRKQWQRQNGSGQYQRISSTRVRQQQDLVLQAASSDKSTSSSSPSSFAQATTIGPKRQRFLLRVLAISTILFLAFVSGYRIGNNYSLSGIVEASSSALQQRVRRFPILATVGLALLVRDGWRALPSWLKRSFRRQIDRLYSQSIKKLSRRHGGIRNNGAVDGVDGVVADGPRMIRRSSPTESPSSSEETSQVSDRPSASVRGVLNSVAKKVVGDDDQSLDFDDADDMTDVRVLATKLQALIDTAQDMLSEQTTPVAAEAEVALDELTVDGKKERPLQPLQEKVSTPPSSKEMKTLEPLLALIQLLAQLKERGTEIRSQIYESNGRLGVWEDVKGLDQMFEYADWAYDEDPSGVPLPELLQGQGFSLLKHDKISVPGRVGHYVAINKEQKLALIGIKGTSNFEDLLTDCCGLAVSHTLDNSFVPGGQTELRCHEGILISSRRLADDLHDFVEQFLLPTGYQIMVVGHSLGAAGAAMLSILLKSRIPELARDVDGERLQVLAFACPPILDYRNAKDCSKFIKSICNNHDVVPRASLSNLVVSLKLLKDVNEKLKEKGLDGSTAKSTIGFFQKLAEGTKGELLMQADELTASIDRAVGTVELDDPNHLYVPGKVITLYEKWETAAVPEEYIGKPTKTKGLPTDSSSKETQNDKPPLEWGVVVSADGSADFLRTIEWDAKMVEDHMAPSYRASIKLVLSHAQEQPENN